MLSPTKIGGAESVAEVRHTALSCGVHGLEFSEAFDAEY